jgi:hypothetical protein
MNSEIVDRRGGTRTEFFIHRDVNSVNLLITDNSDLFHIAYRYKKITPNNIVFFPRKDF